MAYHDEALIRSLALNASALLRDIDSLRFNYQVATRLGGEMASPIDGIGAQSRSKLHTLRETLDEVLAYQS